LQLGIGSIIYVILTRIDILMLGNIMSVEEVAIYDICVLLSFVVWFPYSALVKSSEPIIKKIIKDRKLLKKYNFDLKIAIIISSVIVLMFSLFTTSILSIFGENYNFGKETLIILSFGYLIINFFASPIEFLNMSGYVKISVVILILSLIINIVLNYILINTIGLEGASISTITSLIFSKTIALKYVKKKMKMNLIDFLNIYKLIPLFIFILIYLITKNYLNLFSSSNLFIIKIIAFISFLIISYFLNKEDVKLIFNNK
jgi:O-antigen/teichoic acid export membrane protein